MIDTTYLFPYDLLILEKYNEYLLLFTYVIELVATGEIESPTRGFSVHCSTNWATRPYIFIIKNDHGMARTFDPRIKSALLYQLSYMIFYIKAPKTGLEPITSVLTAPCCLIKDKEMYRYYSIHIESSTVDCSTFFHRQLKKLSTKAERHSFEIRVQWASTTVVSLIDVSL